jgi:hypothetical protein
MNRISRSLQKNETQKASKDLFSKAGQCREKQKGKEEYLLPNM